MSYSSLRREHCPECGSIDNLIVYEYDDGSESYHCYTPGCRNHKHSPEVMQDIRGSKDNPYKNDSTRIPPVDNDGWKSFPQDLKRGIKKKYLDMYGILYNPKGQLLGFPYFREHHYPIAIKYRTPKKDFKWIGHSKDPWLFGRQIVSPKRRVLIITEGELDAIAAAQMTDWAAVSIPNGAQGAIKALKYNLKWIEGFEKVYICFDSDEAGLAASEEAMELIEKGKAYQVILDLKDPCEYLQEGRTEEFKQKLQDARCRSTDAILEQESMLDQFSAYIDRDGDMLDGVPTGIKALDEHFRIREAEVTTLFADASVGKSSVARQIAANWLLGERGGVMYFAFEEHYLKWIEKVINMMADGDFSRENKKRLFDEYRENITISTVISYDLQRIREAIEYGVRTRGVNLVIFDNVTAACSSVGDYNETIRHLYNLFVELGKKYGHHTIAISHTKRDGNLKAGHPPYLTSAYGSSGVEQFSDNIIALGREEGSHYTTVAIRKQRDNGQVGELNQQLVFDPTLKRFTGLDIQKKVIENDRVEEEQPRDKPNGKTKKESTRTATSESEKPGVSRRHEKDGQVRQQDGAKSPRGDKGGLPKPGSGTDSQSNEAVLGRDPFVLELQSRLLGSDAEWEEAVHRVQGALEGLGQAKVAKPTRVPPRQFNYGGSRREPNPATPNENDLPGMGCKVRDFRSK